MTVTIDSDQDQDGSLPLWSNSNVENKYSTRSSIVFGVGAFSKVYLGSNIAKSAKVAIKVIDRSTLFDEEEKRLVAEIEILRELSHANIISESIQYDSSCQLQSFSSTDENSTSTKSPHSRHSSSFSRSEFT